MKYDAVSVGPWDARLGDELYRAARDRGVPVVGPQVQDKGALPYLTKRCGDFRVGITGATYGFAGPEHVAALVEVLKSLREQCDLVILLSQWGTYRDKQFLARPEVSGLVDVVIGGAGASNLREPLMVNGARIVPTSLQGRRVHILEVTFDEQRHPQFRVGSRDLSSDVKPDAAVEQLVQAYYRRRRVEGRKDGELGLAPANICGRCHRSAYEWWRKDAHARAVETLRQRNRLVPECLKCHSEVFRRTGEFVQTSPDGSGVQCVTCHRELHGGDTEARAGAGVTVGAAHVRDPQKHKMSRGSSPKLCLRCHDQEHCPSFDASTFWERLRHW